MAGSAGALPKLGALCKVMSRITLVPKQDHIRRNCWATFLRDPCLLAATYERVNDINMLELTLHLALSLETDEKADVRSPISKYRAMVFNFVFISKNTCEKMRSLIKAQCTNGCWPG